MSILEHAAPAVQDTEFEFVLEQLAALIPEALVGEELGCNGCNRCS